MHTAPTCPPHLSLFRLLAAFILICVFMSASVHADGDPALPEELDTGRHCTGTPEYEPEYWNDGPSVKEIVRGGRCDRGIVQCRNNCYNYANNRRTDTYAQPGLGAGIKLEEKDFTCEQVYRAAIADGLTPVDASGSCPPGTTKVALTVRPGYDYHWYRQDRDGMWSQKMGIFPATDLDNSSQSIFDPEKADTGKYEFCDYLCSCSDERQGQGHEGITGDKNEPRK